MSTNEYRDPVIALVDQMATDIAKDRNMSHQAAHELYVRAMYADLKGRINQFLDLSLTLTRDVSQTSPPLGRELANAFQSVIPALSHVYSFLRDIEKHPKDWPANRFNPYTAPNSEETP